MGNVIGIVAEYNPFHNGHARLIEQTRARLGADCPVVCVMSGDFVQRGSPAVYSKFARAEATAPRGSVLEPPPPWALSSARGFPPARGLLGGLGVVTHRLATSAAMEPCSDDRALLDPLLGQDHAPSCNRHSVCSGAAAAVARRVGALASCCGRQQYSCVE
ncbi:MAG: nucleotidyltransferase family protein [Oscillospiraceae bacterium]